MESSILPAVPPPETAVSAAPNAASLHAKFLALKEETQRLAAENADWNAKKTKAPKPRRWSKKRRLTPPGCCPPPAAKRGAQPCNSNRLRHGKRTRQMNLFRALVRTHIRTSYALVAWVKAEFLQPDRHKSAVEESGTGSPLRSESALKTASKAVSKTR